MPQLPLEQAEYSLAELRQVFADGYSWLYAVPPPPGSLGFAWSVARLETGGKPWNHNFGNIKCPPRCRAEHDWVDISPLLPPSSTEYPYQRAYTDGTAGAAGWWSLLAAKRYAGVLALAEQGRARDAALLMGERGYYGADPELYSSQIERLYLEYVDRWGGPLPEAPRRWWTRLVVAGAAAAAAGAAAWRWSRRA